MRFVVKLGRCYWWYKHCNKNKLIRVECKSDILAKFKFHLPNNSNWNLVCYHCIQESCFFGCEGCICFVHRVSFVWFVSFAHEKHYYILCFLVYQSNLFEFHFASKCIPRYPLIYFHLLYFEYALLLYFFPYKATPHCHFSIILRLVITLCQDSICLKVVRCWFLLWSHVVNNTNWIEHWI